jgi:hypothetical protein
MPVALAMPRVIIGTIHATATGLGDGEEERRIMPAVERHLAAAEYGHLRGVLPRRLVASAGRSF